MFISTSIHYILFISSHIFQKTHIRWGLNVLGLPRNFVSANYKDDMAILFVSHLNIGLLTVHRLQGWPAHPVCISSRAPSWNTQVFWQLLLLWQQVLGNLPLTQNYRDQEISLTSLKWVNLSVCHWIKISQSQGWGVSSVE